MSLLSRGAFIARRRILTGGGRQLRSSSTSSRDDDERIRKSVFVSQSTDVFRNLALEDWLYRNSDFNEHHVLLLWRSEPCVVIGRHQNPWTEANVRASCRNERFALARRNSGGGTVYHDPGNLNLTFFTPRARYDRRYNLEIVSRALYRQWGLKSVVNKRDDIIIEDDYKISGTAAKLGRPNAYHHCTLLVDVNKAALCEALNAKEDGITSNATASKRSLIKNLSEVNKTIEMNRLIDAVGWEYLRTKALVLEDGGQDLIQRQKGFQLINPTDDWFPGLEELVNTFRSWEWTYGKTPRFTVTRQLEVRGSNDAIHRLTLILEVVEGIVEEIRLSLPPGLAPSEHLDDEVSVVTTLRGTRYDHAVAENIVAAIGGKTVAVGAAVAGNQGKSNMVATQ